MTNSQTSDVNKERIWCTKEKLCQLTFQFGSQNFLKGSGIKTNVSAEYVYYAKLIACFTERGQEGDKGDEI